MAVRQPSTFAFGVTPTKKAGWAALKAHGVTAELQAHGLAKSKSLRDVAAAKQQLLEESTTFWTAARGGDLRTCEIMLDAGQNVNQPDEQGVSALSWAVFGGHAHVVRFLLKRGANPNQPDRHTGRVPLHYCSVRGEKPDCAKALLRAGADVSVRSAKLGTPRDWAQKNGAAQVVQLLEAVSQSSA